LKNINKFNLPSEILREYQDGNENIHDTISEVNGFLKELGSTKGSLSKPKSKKEENADKIDMIDKEIDLLRRYKARIKIIPEGRKTVGEGIRNYKQPNRNAYKIDSKNSYGGLMIDVDKLLNEKLIEMLIHAYRDGQKMYDAVADKSLINLLTKRYNLKTKYTQNAMKIFNDFNMLSNMPQHKSSGKSKMIRSSIMDYSDPHQLADRMKIAVGSIIAENNSKVVKNDLSVVNDETLKIGAKIRTCMKLFIKNASNRFV